jgi:ATP-binding cassette, subfamily F, member 3
LISISSLSHSFGSKTLFHNISLTINRGEKIGLIGPNGAGKSTLFHFILGDAEPQEGQVITPKGVRAGYLPQEMHFSSTNTVLGELTEGDEHIKNLRRQKDDLEANHQAGTQAYGDVLHELETLGFFTLEHKAKFILAGLGFKEKDFTKSVAALSGGWQMRTLLGKLLTYPYDVLLLDEPTNYLDLNAALWLKDYLASFQGTFIMISHDKAFLTEVTNYTLILENGSVYKVQGNYEHYEEIKRRNLIFLEKQFKEQEKKREQLEQFVARFHAQPNKAAAVRSKRTALERLEKEAVKLPEDARRSIASFRFPPAASSGHRVMRLEGISKAYADVQVYRDFDFEITKGERAVLAGENGAGKSTLLKILAGVIPIDAGERIAGHHVEPGYFSQTRTDVLNVENSVLQEAYSAAPGYMAREQLRAILGAFLFRGDDVDKPVRVLSGGEKSRLILAKLLINPPNLLLLDEPTTHLDVDAIDALVKALLDYQGTIVFISHDIHFVRSVANVVFEVKDGRVRKFPGAFDYYLEKKDHMPAQGVVSAVKVDKGKANLEAREREGHAQKKHDDEERKRKEHNAAIKLEVEKLLRRKEALKLEHAAKSRTLSSPRDYHSEKMRLDYKQRLAVIEELIIDVDAQVKKLRAQKL